jgi:RNA polymerase sigma-70 factor (ECF subfamily)
MISIRRLGFAKWRRPETDAAAIVPEIYRYVFARINHVEQAEDISMEVLHIATSSPPPNDLKAYMIGIARRKVADHFRQNARTQSMASTDEPFETKNSDEFIRIQMVLGRLAENYQECLVLKYVCGFSSEEIAGMIDGTATSVDNTLQRARKAFATEWNLLNGDER